MPAKSKAQQKAAGARPWPSSGARPTSPACKVPRKRCSESMTEEELEEIASTSTMICPTRLTKTTDRRALGSRKRSRPRSRNGPGGRIFARQSPDP